MHKPELIIGLMSGTSADGIDAALVEFSSYDKLNVIETQFTAFDTSIRNAINELVFEASIDSPEQTPLHTQLADYYAQASLSLIKKSAHQASDISAIANHGQTVRHEPNAQPPYSLQLGDGQLIANQTGITTITQFRQADLAAGGQGAPLMPAFHKALFNNQALILNIGGIANLSHLYEPVIGFDIGPGNTLMDQWIQQHKNKPYDSQGTWADSGKVVDDVLTVLLGDPYFSQAWPKSTGPDYFNLAWLYNQVPKLNDYRPQDIQATLLALTTRTICDQIKKFSHCRSLYLCGGGAHNTALVQALKNGLPAHTIEQTDTLGIPIDWVECVGFAWLGYCKLHNINSNLPNVTGASNSCVLGQMFTPI